MRRSTSYKKKNHFENSQIYVQNYSLSQKYFLYDINDCNNEKIVTQGSFSNGMFKLEQYPVMKTLNISTGL